MPALTTKMPSAASLSLFQLLDPAVLADPYPLYQRLREHDPVHWDPYLHSWVVTSYPEVVAVLTKYSADRTPTPEQLASLGLTEMKPFAEMMGQQMLFADAPAHTRLRTLCSVAFTPRRVEGLRDDVEEIANSLIDDIIASGSMEVISDFANAFPAIVTARLLGVPTRDHEQLKKWSADFAELLGNFQHNPDRVAKVLRSLEDLKEYVREKMGEQRKEAQPGLIGSLMAAEVEGGHLTDGEVIASSIVTMVGGQETTTNLIGNGLFTLLNRPDCLAQLRDDPSIIASAIEELLRFESPSQHTARIAKDDVLLGGKTIKKGEAVMAVMAAANRDPNRFPEPDKLDLTRTDNRHVAFGWAAHYCFGAPLARLEGAIAFNTILKRLKGLALVDEKPEWRGNTGLRGLTSLRVGFQPGVPVGIAGAGVPAVNARAWTPQAGARCPFPH
jgi:pimeloyl-[acyl-carrier protein] synthase